MCVMHILIDSARRKVFPREEGLRLARFVGQSLEAVSAVVESKSPMLVLEIPTAGTE